MSHADQMDNVYRLQRHIYDLTRKFYLLGRDPVLKSLDVRPGQSLLEVGCGTARNLVLAAKIFPEARLFGIDASEEMLKTAQENIDRAGMTDRIKVGFGYAENFDPAALFELQEPIDHFLYSYSLSMIPDWQGALSHGARLLGPGGQLHVVDFGDQARLPNWFSSLLTQWLRRFHVTIRRDLPGFMQKLADDGAAVADVRPLYRGYSIRGSLFFPTTETSAAV